MTSVRLVAPPIESHARAPIFEIEPEQFRADFNQRPFLIGHRLVGHPLFELPRLIELARRMPDDLVEYYAGNLPRSIDWHLTPKNGLSVEETIHRIEHCCSWMVLKRVDVDPEYRALLDECLDEIEAHTRPLDPGMRERAGAVFISSHGAVTPYHMDVEYNFLVHLRGKKRFHVYPGGDRTIVSEREIEEHLSRGGPNRNLAFFERYDEKAHVLELTPGYALHVPSLDPHWVQVEEGPAISFSCGFLTRRSDRKAAIHLVNHRLRRMGFSPTPYGASPLGDTLKRLCSYALARAPRGSYAGESGS